MALADVVGDLGGEGRGPLYRRLHRALRAAIEDRRLASDAALPPERDIAAELGMSRITVRKALDALAGEGLVHRRHGAGTFVAARVEKSFSTLSSFSEDMASRGRTTRSEWLARSSGTVSPEEALVLGLGPGSAILRFERIRFADDVAMALEHASIPGDCLPSAEAVTGSLYAALAASGCRPVRALQRLRAVRFTPAQAALLGIEAGAPGLLIERRGFADDGRGVEFTRSWYRGDRYDFVAELQLGAAR